MNKRNISTLLVEFHGFSRFRVQFQCFHFCHLFTLKLQVTNFTVAIKITTQSGKMKKTIRTNEFGFKKIPPKYVFIGRLPYLMTYGKEQTLLPQRNKIKKKSKII